MSSPNGPTLEDFVADALMNTTPAQNAAVVKLLEAYRDGIEAKVAEWYDAGDDAPSWRDYRNALWDSIVLRGDALHEAIKEATARNIGTKGAQE